MSLRCALRAAACAARRGPAAAAARSVAPLSAALGLRRAGGVPAAGSHSDFLPKAKGTGGAGGEAEVKAAALAEIDKLVKGNKVMIFIKGPPEQPQCGFSMQVVRILNFYGVAFTACNILEHPAIRANIKHYVDWPTLPQVFVDGQFVGGCDILTEMHKSGELEKTFGHMPPAAAAAVGSEKKA